MVPGCDCQNTDCCSHWVDYIDEVLDVAHAAVSDCSTSGCCGSYEKFQAAGEPHYPIDYVAAWLVELTRVQPRQGNTQPKMLLANPPRLTIGFKVSDSNYPMISAVGANDIQLPAIDDIKAASRHSVIHGLAMYHAVIAHLVGCGTFQGVGPLRVVGPSGGFIGWTFTVTVQT